MDFASTEVAIKSDYGSNYFSERAVASPLTAAVAEDLSTAVFVFDSGNVKIAKYPASKVRSELGRLYEGLDACGTNHTNKGTFMHMARPTANSPGKVVIGLSVKGHVDKIINTETISDGDLLPTLSAADVFLDLYGKYQCGRQDYDDGKKMTVEERFYAALKNLFGTTTEEDIDRTSMIAAIKPNGDIGSVMFTKEQLLASSRYLSGHVRYNANNTVRLDDIDELQFPLTLLQDGGRAWTIMMHFLRRSRHRTLTVVNDGKQIAADQAYPLAVASGGVGWTWKKIYNVQTGRESKINWYLDVQALTGTLIPKDYSFSVRIKYLRTTSNPMVIMYTRRTGAVKTPAQGSSWYDTALAWKVKSTDLTGIAIGDEALLVHGPNVPRDVFGTTKLFELEVDPESTKGLNTNISTSTEIVDKMALYTNSGSLHNAEEFVLTHFSIHKGKYIEHFLFDA